MADALGSLPVAALRLPADQVARPHDVGIERIAQLARKPRNALRLRFGPDATLRLDQVLGALPETLAALQPPEVPRVRLTFAEPVSDPGFGIEIAALTASCVEALSERQTIGRQVAEKDSAADLASLVDALRVWLGPSRVFRLTDRNSVAGLARAHTAARVTGVRLIAGCRLDLTDFPPLLVYPTDRPACSRLCRLLTLGKGRAGKGACRLTARASFMTRSKPNSSTRPATGIV